jgi:hypothetical protein
MRLYYGVVENNIDEEMLGRVQVRIVGKHTENRTDPTLPDYMPVTDLPWAQTLQSGTVMSNESSQFSVPKNGSVVVLSYIDDEEQFPIILGSVPKIPDAIPDFSVGFSDPNGEHPTLSSMGVSPVSNYATGFPVPIPVMAKKADAEIAVQCVDRVWNEPESTFDPDYPDNLVIQNGDSVLELDNSSGKERINLQHKSGSFKEIHPDGVQVTKVKGKEYLIVEGDRNLLIKGNSNITVRGLTSGFKVDSLSNIHLKAATSITVDTDGALIINAVTGTINITGMLMVTAGMISLN